MLRPCLLLLLLAACEADPPALGPDSGTRTPRFPTTPGPDAGSDADSGVPCTTSGPEVLATVSLAIGDLAADDEYIYFTETGTNTGGGQAGAVGRILHNGGAPEVIAANEALPSWLGVDHRAVYWTAGRSGVGTSTAGIRFLPHGAEAPLTLWRGQAYRFGVGAGYLLAWTLNATERVELRRFVLPAAPGNPSTVVRTLPMDTWAGQFGLVRITSRAAYWVEMASTAAVDPEPPRILELLHTENTPRVIVEGLENDFFAASDDFLYFLEPAEPPGFVRYELASGREEFVPTPRLDLPLSVLSAFELGVGGLYAAWIGVDRSAAVDRLHLEGGPACRALLDPNHGAPSTIYLGLPYRPVGEFVYYRRDFRQIARFPR